VVDAIVEDDLQKYIEVETYEYICRAELDYLNPDCCPVEAFIVPNFVNFDKNQSSNYIHI
jgi:hypothetical protein